MTLYYDDEAPIGIIPALKLWDYDFQDMLIEFLEITNSFKNLFNYLILKELDFKELTDILHLSRTVNNAS